MNLSYYMTGNGVDVSKINNLPINNFYSLKSIAAPESLDFVYAPLMVNNTKFYRILIKEWLNACKVGGFIIIIAKSNKILDILSLKKEILLLTPKIKIIEEKIDDEEITIILKKITPALNPNDKIDRWTFGILTNGVKKDWVQKEIQSIIDLKIPKFEIILCGVYNGKLPKQVTFMPFDSSKPWICKKKNAICKKAKYENIVITHDKFIFDKNWYKGMKEYGNFFEVLSCVIHDTNEKRAGDWLTCGSKFSKMPKIGMLEYEDWDSFGYIDGGFYILKKEVWQKVKWNESLMHNQAEDINLSKNFYLNGITARFNPFSKVTTLNWRHGALRTYAFNPYFTPRARTTLSNFLKYYFKRNAKKIIPKYAIDFLSKQIKNSLCKIKKKYLIYL